MYKNSLPKNHDCLIIRNFKFLGTALANSGSSALDEISISTKRLNKRFDFFCKYLINPFFGLCLISVLILLPYIHSPADIWKKWMGSFHGQFWLHNHTECTAPTKVILGLIQTLKCCELQCDMCAAHGPQMTAVHDIWSLNPGKPLKTTANVFFIILVSRTSSGYPIQMIIFEQLKFTIAKQKK